MPARKLTREQARAMRELEAEPLPLPSELLDDLIMDGLVRLSSPSGLSLTPAGRVLLGEQT